MGMYNPNTKRYEPVVRRITKDLKPATKAEDVIAHQFADGTVVGGADYAQFEEARKEIEEKHMKAILDLQAKRRGELAAALNNFTGRVGGD